ncbi:MAG TPA: hypothetical protein ENK19_06420 [Acidobacteria bacterium]|nr:hypothetical protein [Acidobacteriota bacterium]
MPEQITLRDAVKDRGPYAVWDLLTEEEQRAAAAAAWDGAEGEGRLLLQATMAKELKFRPQTIKRLPAAKVAGRLAHMAKRLPEDVVFQLLFHFHLAERRELLGEFLDAVGLPHDNGVLDLPEDAAPPDEEKVREAARALVEAHGREALVYLATLYVADRDFWAGVEEALTTRDAAGELLKA